MAAARWRCWRPQPTARSAACACRCPHSRGRAPKTSRWAETRVLRFGVGQGRDPEPLIPTTTQRHPKGGAGQSCWMQQRSPHRARVAQSIKAFAAAAPAAHQSKHLLIPRGRMCKPLSPHHPIPSCCSCGARILTEPCCSPGWMPTPRRSPRWQQAQVGGALGQRHE